MNEVELVGSAPRRLDPIPRELIGRWLAVILLAFFAFASFVHLHRFYERRFLASTGDAHWIWTHAPLSADRPLVFFAARSFVPPDEWTLARMKIGGDPQYTVFLNGVEIAGGRWRGTIDAYDISSLVRPGLNRIVIGVRSPRGVGGLLVALDFGPVLRNAVVSDGSWRIDHRWSTELLRGEDPRLGLSAPRLLGRPPFGKWDYPEVMDAELYPDHYEVVRPGRAARFIGSLPKISVIGGVAVAGSERIEATRFDFGRIRGRVRIATTPQGGGRVIRVRFGSGLMETEAEDGPVETLVMAEGESSVLDPEEREFRYLVVYETDVEAAVLTPKTR